MRSDGLGRPEEGSGRRDDGWAWRTASGELVPAAPRAHTLGMRPSKARLLDELRRRHNRESASLTPTQRIERARALNALAASVARDRPGRPTDEPPQLLLDMLAHFRRCATRQTA